MLNVPYFRQEHAQTCLPACVRMILAYRGKHHTERELAEQFSTISFLGTSAQNARDGLEEMGYNALWFEYASLERLQNLLANSWPVIIFLPAAQLPHGSSGHHAVVLVEVGESYVICLDPTLEEPLNLPLPVFLKAWSMLDFQGMVVWI